VVVHRQDGGGTTYVWTDYLSKVSTDWRDRVGKGISAISDLGGHTLLYVKSLGANHGLPG
jgi:ABC-type phosphate transport system substrate-binding protein